MANYQFSNSCIFPKTECKTSDDYYRSDFILLVHISTSNINVNYQYIMKQLTICPLTLQAAYAYRRYNTIAINVCGFVEKYYNTKVSIKI